MEVLSYSVLSCSPVQVLGFLCLEEKRKKKSIKFQTLHYLAGMDELMEVSFSPLAATGKPLSRCGKCHRFMKYIQVNSS